MATQLEVEEVLPCVQPLHICLWMLGGFKLFMISFSKVWTCKNMEQSGSHYILRLCKAILEKSDRYPEYCILPVVPMADRDLRSIGISKLQCAVLLCLGCPPLLCSGSILITLHSNILHHQLYIYMLIWSLLMTILSESGHVLLLYFFSAFEGPQHLSTGPSQLQTRIHLLDWIYQNQPSHCFRDWLLWVQYVVDVLF